MEGSAKRDFYYGSRVQKGPVVRSFMLGASVAGVALVVGACGSAEPPPTPHSPIEERAKATSVEIAELEISEFGADRFTHCPPPGELGQRWIPPIPAWTPSAAAVSFAIKDGEGDAQPPPTPPGQAARLEQIAQSTRAQFRHCYNRGLLHDPTQDGHVAIVLRLARDGRIAQVEAYGACDISTETIRCMMDTAKTMRLDPPQPGAETITVPVVFDQNTRTRREPGPNDIYTAAAYVALEAARPAFHACEEKARKGNKSVVATATFALDLDDKGKVAHAHVDPWSGDQELLACAAEAMDKVGFPPPPHGRAHALVKLSFNPRPGTK